MSILEIKRENAIEAFENGTPKQRALLENLFGKSVFIKDIKQRVKTYTDACEVLSIDPNSIPEHDRILIIRKALVEGWSPNWSDSNQYKYYPWMKFSGSGFSFGGFAGDLTLTFVGSRLCYPTRELAEYAGKQFSKEYTDYLTFEI